MLLENSRKKNFANAYILAKIFNGDFLKESEKKRFCCSGVALESNTVHVSISIVKLVFCRHDENYSGGRMHL